VELQDLASATEAARVGTVRLSEHDQLCRQAHAAAVKAHKRLLAASPPPDEVVANMRALVAKKCADRTTYHARGIVQAFGGTREENILTGQLDYRKPSLYRPAADSGRLTFEDLIAFLPNLVADRLEQIIRAAPYEAGAPEAHRPRLIAEAVEKIRAIESEHSALVDAAAQLDPPIVLQLLPSVQAARERENEKAKRQQVAIEMQRQAEAEVNQQAARGSSGRRSQYVAALERDRPR
jgi:hypothetical protein